MWISGFLLTSAQNSVITWVSIENAKYLRSICWSWLSTSGSLEVPPRQMFLAQTIATFIACFVQVGVQAWMFGAIPDICHPHQPGKPILLTLSCLTHLTFRSIHLSKCSSIRHCVTHMGRCGTSAKLQFWSTLSSPTVRPCFVIPDYFMKILCGISNVLFTLGISSCLVPYCPFHSITARVNGHSL